MWGHTTCIKLHKNVLAREGYWVSSPRCVGGKGLEHVTLLDWAQKVGCVITGRGWETFKSGDDRR